MNNRTDASPSSDGKQLTVIAILKAKAGQGDELGRRLLALSEPARAEAGNINYDLHRSNDDPTTWILYENWATPSDLDAHFREQYMKDFASKLGDVLEGGMDLRRCSMVTHVAAPKT